MGYLIIFMGLGLATGLLRYVVLAESDEKKKATFIYAVKRGTLINISIVFLGLFYVTAFPHPRVFVNHRIIGYLLVLSIPFLYLTNTSLSTLRALFKNKLYSYVSFVSSALTIVFRVLGAAMSGLKTSVFFQLGASVISAFFSTCLILNILFSRCMKVKLDKSFTSSFNNFSLQIMLTNALWTVFMLNDMFLLGQLTGSETTIADYKIANVIPANLSILTSSISIFVSPYFTKKENEKDFTWVKKKFRTVLLSTSIIMGTAAIFCFVFAEPLISFIYGKNYLSAIPIMRILLLASFVNNGVRASIANILSSIGKQKINLIIAGIGIILQIVLNVIFIPKNGATAVAIISVIVYFAMTALLIVDGIESHGFEPGVPCKIFEDKLRLLMNEKYFNKYF